MSSLFWALAIVTSLSAVISTGFSVAALVGKGDRLINAMYAASRSVALAAVSFVPLLTGSGTWLVAIALAMTIVQIIDALIGFKQRDTMKTVGPAFLAVINGVLLILFIH